MRILIDTNVFLVIVSRKSKYHWLFRTFLEEKFDLALTNEIMTEYEEQFAVHWNEEKAEAVLNTILEAPNTSFFVVYFHFNLVPNDPDDNKFADCYISARAEYLITFDTDFNHLKKLSFPKINVIHPDEFKQILLDLNLLEP